MAWCPCARGTAFGVLLMSGSSPLSLVRHRLVEASIRRHWRNTRMFSSDAQAEEPQEPQGGSSGSGAMDPEEPQGGNSGSGAMDPASVLAALDPIMTKRCGSGHCTSVFMVADGWKARISVPWPREFSVDATAPSKKESIAIAKTLMCSELQRMGVVDNFEIRIPQGAPAEARAPITNPSCSSLSRNPVPNGTPTPSMIEPSPVLDGTLSPALAERQLQHGGCPPTPPARHVSGVQTQEMEQRDAALPVHGLKSWSRKRELSRAKCVIHNIYAYVSKIKSDKSLMPTYISNLKQGAFAQWTSTVIVQWPCELAFEGTANNKSEAEALASMGLVEYLVEKGHVDKDLSPKTASDQEVRRHKKQRIAPVPVTLPESCVPEMEEVLKEFEHLLARTPCLQDNTLCGSSDLLPNGAGDSERSFFDIMTGRPLRPSDEFNQRRDQELLSRAEKSWNFTHELARKELPIFPHREQIMSAVNRERVVVICGETGSGKTTQVPQYILEDHVRHRQGSRCNIVITQPRRLAAISMAKRVAAERREDLGDTVGFQVKLSKNLLSVRGGMLFCTVGILLRHLQHNSKLLGLSHVIVDEVHERDVRTDFLLVLLRELLLTNSRIKVILMSATINADKFSDYFDGAPVVRVPGKMHPVTQFFLEDIVSEGIVTRELLEKCCEDPVKMVPDVLTYIMEMKPPGAVLCFLPGWNEINKVRQELCRRAPPKFHDWILPLHSRMQHQEQQRIFGSPPSDVRKVILATNIAETSITINDVVYVVDTGLHREQRYDPSTGVSLLGTFRTSQASVRQRAGRAGRVRPGESYHLFTQEDLRSWEAFGRPEIQTIDLKKVVLDCKLFCPSSCVENVLSLAMDPPPPEMIMKAIEDLQVMGLMDFNEELTDLGHHVVHFSLEPHLAKAVMFAALLGCMDPVVSTVTLLSEAPNLFANKRTDVASRSDTKRVKQCFDRTGTSDHAALSQILLDWNNYSSGAEQHSFCQRNDLNQFSLELGKGMADDTVRTFTRVLANTEALSQAPARKRWAVEINTNKLNRQLMLAALVAGFYPNVLRVLQGKIKKNQIIREGVEFANLDQKLAAISEDSLLHRTPPEYEHPWLVYYSALKPSAHQLTTVYDCSMVTSLHLLLFAGCGAHIIEDYVFDARAKASVQTGQDCLVIDEQRLLSFRCSKRDANLIWRWRRMIDYMVDLHLSLHEWEIPSSEETILRQELWPKIVDSTSNLLSQR